MVTGSWAWHERPVLRASTLPTSAGRKQDAWFVVDPESGETQTTLTTESPSTPRLYIGRTRESGRSQPLPKLWAAPRFALPRPASCYPG